MLFRQMMISLRLGSEPLLAALVIALIGVVHVVFSQVYLQGLTIFESFNAMSALIGNVVLTVYLFDMSRED